MADRVSTDSTRPGGSRLYVVLSSVFVVGFTQLAWPQTRMQEVVTEVWVHDVPGPPQGEFWDSVAGNLFSTLSHPGGIYPDVMVCARPISGGKPTCTDVCWDMQGDTHLGHQSEECRRPLRLQLPPNDPRIQFEVLEMNMSGDRVNVHAIIAPDVRVADPGKCPHDQPCRTDTPKGPLVFSFSTQVRGVLGTLPTPTPPTPSATPAPPAASSPGSPAAAAPFWQPAVDLAKRLLTKWAQSKDPTADAGEVAQRSAEAIQRDVNLCLAQVAHPDDTLRSRMPRCAALTGKPFEDCMFSQVLSDNDTALTAGYACKKHYQSQVTTIGKTSVYVWMKGKICGVGQWLGINACKN